MPERGFRVPGRSVGSPGREASRHAQRRSAADRLCFIFANHDQIGNRAVGERLTSLAEPAALEAAIALQLLCPQIPLIFMGEETATDAPFLFFTDHNEKLAQAVREGRRREFASFPQFSDPTLLKKIPDPNDEETFERSHPFIDQTLNHRRKDFYERLLGLRRAYIIPRLIGARATDANAIGEAAVVARWRMGDGATLTLACNLAGQAMEIEPLAGEILFATSEGALNSYRVGQLEAYTTIAQLTPQ